MRARAAGDIAAAPLPALLPPPPLPALPLPAAPAPPLPVFHAPPEFCGAYGREDDEGAACRCEEREIHSPGLGAAYDTTGHAPKKRTTRHENNGDGNGLCGCQAETRWEGRGLPRQHETHAKKKKTGNRPKIGDVKSEMTCSSSTTAAPPAAGRQDGITPYETLTTARGWGADDPHVTPLP